MKREIKLRQLPFKQRNFRTEAAAPTIFAGIGTEDVTQGGDKKIVWQPGESKRFIDGVLVYRSYGDYCWD